MESQLQKDGLQKFKLLSIVLSPFQNPILLKNF